MASATNHRAAARSQDSAPGCPLVHAKPTAEPTRRPPSSRPIAEHPLCGPYREPQLQQAPTKRDPPSSLSRASIKASRNPRNDRRNRAAAETASFQDPRLRPLRFTAWFGVTCESTQSFRPVALLGRWSLRLWHRYYSRNLDVSNSVRNSQ